MNLYRKDFHSLRRGGVCGGVNELLIHVVQLDNMGLCSVGPQGFQPFSVISNLSPLAC